MYMSMEEMPAPQSVQKEKSPRLKTKEYFGNFLEERRKETGKSVREVAKRIGERESYVEAMEYGHVFPSKDKLLKIAEAYGCDAGKLRVAFEVSQK